MKIGVFQFEACGDIGRNLALMSDALCRAASAEAELVVFPECALTGYPPKDMESAAAIDFTALRDAHEALSDLAGQLRVTILTGTVLEKRGNCYDSALLLRPDGSRESYAKRALWGWDRDNFTPGDGGGVFTACGLRIGVRICYEVRFPEYFRELYRRGTELNVILFNDTAAHDDPERYALIGAHVRTRAVENVCPVLSVNVCAPCQTAPTALIDASGHTLFEAEPGKRHLIVHDFRPQPLTFGERGRKELSDELTARGRH